MRLYDVPDFNLVDGKCKVFALNGRARDETLIPYDPIKRHLPFFTQKILVQRLGEPAEIFKIAKVDVSRLQESTSALVASPHHHAELQVFRVCPDFRLLAPHQTTHSNGSDDKNPGEELGVHQMNNRRQRNSGFPQTEADPHHRLRV